MFNLAASVRVNGGNSNPIISSEHKMHEVVYDDGLLVVEAISLLAVEATATEAQMLAQR